MSDTSDDSEGLYARIDELLAEIDEACEISEDGMMPLPAAAKPLPEHDLLETDESGAEASTDEPAEAATATDDIEEDGPPSAPAEPVASEPDAELSEPDADEPDLAEPDLAEPDFEEPAGETEPAAEAEQTGEPAGEAEQAESPDDALLAAINAQLAGLNEPEAEQANEPEPPAVQDDAPQAAAEEPEPEPKPAETTSAAPEPAIAEQPEDSYDTSDADVEMDASDLDDLVAELDAQQGQPPTTRPAPAADLAEKPQESGRAEPERPAARSTPPISAPQEPEPVTEPVPEPKPLAAPKPAPPPKRKDFEPVLATAYRVGAVALAPIGKVLDTQPRVVRDTIGWIGAITVFYAIFLWLYPLVFRGGAEPSPNAQGVTIVDGAAEGE